MDQSRYGRRRASRGRRRDADLDAHDRDVGRRGTGVEAGSGYVTESDGTHGGWAPSGYESTDDLSAADAEYRDPALDYDDPDLEYDDHEYGDHEDDDHEDDDHEDGDHEDGDHAIDASDDPRHGGGGPRRFRPGRGGYDPEAAALAARARYAFRQRMVVGLVLLAVATGLVAGGLRLTEAWLVHVTVDLCLIGYLVYLRRQVRMEQAIRARRAARLNGARGAHGPEHAGRRGTVADAVAARDAARRPRPNTDDVDHDGLDHDDLDEDAGDRDADHSGDRDDDTDRDGAPADPDTSGDGAEAGPVEEIDDTPALPRLRPAPPPAPPRGTTVLELDDEDPELHELDHPAIRGYRRAAGQ
jgi:hypothetical protein